jgi:hypothetical protein
LELALVTNRGNVEMRLLYITGPMGTGIRTFVGADFLQCKGLLLR